MGQVFETNDPKDNAVFGRNDATSAPPDDGGVHATGVFGLTVSPGAAGVFGANNSTKGVGVQGNGPFKVNGPDSVGVGGFSDAGFGVFAQSNTGSGVVTRSGTGHGLDAFGDKDIAVFAQGGTFSGVFNGALVVNKTPNLNPDPNNPAKDLNGSIVINDGNLFLNKGGVVAKTPTGSGVVVTSDTGHGVDVFSNNDIAVFAQGGTFSGVFNGALVVNKTPQLNPDPNNPAKPIDGSIVINDGNLFLNKGDIFLANAADCAEDFGVSGQAEPGTVMVLDDDGRLRESSAEYDRRVAGVISGACSYKAGLVLDRRPGEAHRAPLALVGKTYCKVDADFGAIEVGDLLTTSSTPGRAMKATDPMKAFGAVIGKALVRCQAGCALIPILIALQ
jgi:hypothetical protein